jgi:glycosyltransferase involved in cell wall biosynthesis
MRMLFAHDHIFDRVGDESYFSEKLPYNVWRLYLERFSEIMIYARQRKVGASRKPKAVGAGVTVHPLPTLSSPVAILRNRLKAFAAVRDAVRRADAVVVRLPSEIGLVTFWSAYRQRKPTLVEMVGSPRESLRHHGTASGKAYSLIASWRNRRALRHASHVIYVTREYLQRNYPTRGKSVGISDVQLEPVPASILTKRRAQPKDVSAPIRVGMIGQLLHYKGIGTLLQACCRLRREGYPVSVEVLGSGDPAPWRHLAEHIGYAEHCAFLGTKATGSAVFEWLDSVDIYVQPSLTEGLSRATLEALSRGCPVVASRVGGLPEIVQDANLCKPGDIDDLTDRLRRMITDAPWRTQCSTENFSTAQKYTEDVLFARRRDFLDQFIRDSGLKSTISRNHSAHR